LGSDIDLAIMNGSVPIKTLLKLKNDFEESSLPYFVDIVNYSNLKNPDLKQHIQRVGQSIYSQE
jgi:predicted nucleotidyltransferase